MIGMIADMSAYSLPFAEVLWIMLNVAPSPTWDSVSKPLNGLGPFHEVRVLKRFLFGLSDGNIIQTGEMVISLHEKSKLFKTLTSWNGTMPFSGFDTESQVGKGATLNILRKTSAKGREYADISAIMPIMAGMEAQVPDRARFGLPKEEVPAPIQQAPVVQPVQPAQQFNPQPIQQAPVQQPV